jgi:hypothetical protein
MASASGATRAGCGRSAMRLWRTRSGGCRCAATTGSRSPTRGYTLAVYGVIAEAEAAGEHLTEDQIAERAVTYSLKLGWKVGMEALWKGRISRSSVSRAKRWLKRHHWLDWLHFRRRWARWATCLYFTDVTVIVRQVFAQTDTSLLNRLMEAAGSRKSRAEGPACGGLGASAGRQSPPDVVRHGPNREEDRAGVGRGDGPCPPLRPRDGRSSIPARA